MKIYYVQKLIQEFIAALFIIAKNLEQPKCSIEGLKLIVVYLYNEIKLGNKKKRITDTYNMDDFSKHHVKKILIPISRDYMIPFI